MSIKCTILGSGDAFNSGGRSNSCFMIENSHKRFLIDCGQGALQHLKKEIYHLTTLMAS